MNKTKIEWCDYTWNPIKGYCPNNCTYCYAHRMYNRFGWDKTIRFDSKELLSASHIKKPSRVFMGSTIDMFHPNIPEEWIDRIMQYAGQFCHYHTLVTLTKYPQNMAKHILPSKIWAGMTIDYGHNIKVLSNFEYFNKMFKISGVKFISFEPLLTSMEYVELDNIGWIIVGGLTPKPVHKQVWIDDIVKRADDCNIPVFIKKNAHYPEKREDFPNGKTKKTHSS